MGRPLASSQKEKIKLPLPATITPKKPKTPGKSAGSAKQPLALSGDKSRVPAKKKARKASCQNPAFGG